MQELSNRFHCLSIFVSRLVVYAPRGGERRGGGYLRTEQFHRVISDRDDLERVGNKEKQE